jgi:hypothetical protein
MTFNADRSENRSLTEVLQEHVHAERLLSRSLASYKGKWVGIRNHQVVADADSLDELIARLKNKSVDRVQEVPAKRAAAVFF